MRLPDKWRTDVYAANKVPEPFYYSPSQVATYRDCPRKWFFSRTLKRPRKDTASTILGKKIHSEMEGWFKEKTAPTNPRAKALIPLLPLPHPSLLIEHEIRLLTPAGLVKGFSDLLAPDPYAPGLVWPVDLPVEPTVFDHKSTADLWYAKTEEDLRSDPQALLYGLALRVLIKEAGATPPNDVQLVWDYTQTRGEVAARAVRRLQTMAEMEAGLEGVFVDANQMRAYLSLQAGSTDPAKATEMNVFSGTKVPCDTNACSKYGGCEFADVCPNARRSEKNSATIEPEPNLVSIARRTASPGANVATTEEVLARLRRARENPVVVSDAAAAPVVVSDAAPAPSGAPAPVSTPSTPPPGITPEPKLEPLDVSGVPAEPSGNAQVVPPDAPKRRGRPPKAKGTDAEAVIDAGAAAAGATTTDQFFQDALLTELRGINRSLEKLLELAAKQAEQ